MARSLDPATPGQLLLSYRILREPSTPRITVWRKLKRLGVAQLGDGLVALPADARTREQIDWIAEDITEAGGTAGVWLSQPATLAQERDLAVGMAAEVPADSTPFDMRGLELSHHHGDCSFETILRRYDLMDRLLWKIAGISPLRSHHRRCRADRPGIPASGRLNR